MTVETESWRDAAACRRWPTEWWFSTSKDPRDYDLPRSICAGCPVKDQCLEDAVAGEQQFGMWAGLTPKQLRRVRMDRRRAAA